MMWLGLVSPIEIRWGRELHRLAGIHLSFTMQARIIPGYRTDVMRVQAA
jgi:hypothetical protein